MYRVEARYFDGQSSKPHTVVVFTDERFDKLRLQCADGSSFFWDIDDLIFEQYEDCLELRNNQFSGVLLQIIDENFTKSFLEAMKFKNKLDVHRRILNIGFPKIVGLAVGMLALVVAAYFFLLPPIAERFVAVVPQSADIALGNMFMNTFLNENRIDSTKTAYLEQFAAQIDFKNTIPLNFTVVESGQINAFALPNGQIVVYTGLLDRLQHSSELAALLVHEAAHVNHRHSMKMLFRNLAGYLLVSLLFTDVSGIMAVLADNAHRLHNLSYSRKFEREADEQGLKILMNNHIDPNGMVQLFVLLEKVSKLPIPQIVSTHPLTAERKVNMQKIIEKSEYSLLQNNYLDSLFAQMQRTTN